MTALLSRPILRVSAPVAAPERPLVLVAAVASAAVAVGGLLLFMAVAIAGWFAATGTGSVDQALRVGALGWLAGNGSGLSGGGVLVHAAPLGFLLLCGYALYRAGRWAGETCHVPGPWYVALAALAMAACYGAIGTVTALVAQVDAVHAPLPRTALAFLSVAAVSGGAGLLRGTRSGPLLVGRLPHEVRAALVGGASGVCAMLAVSAAVLVGSLAVHLSTAVTLAEGQHSGVVGAVILAIVGAALVPNAVLCAGAFVAGPGFSVGTGTQVAPGGVRIGLLPDVPVLAALPTSADAWWMPVLVTLPVLAGAAAGLVAIRRFPAYGVDRAALRGALSGLVGGVSFGLLTALATGSVAPGRLSEVGPDVLATTAVCAVAFVFGGALAAVGRHWLGGVLQRRRPAAAEPAAPQMAEPAPEPVPEPPLAGGDEPTQQIPLH